MAVEIHCDLDRGVSKLLRDVGGRHAPAEHQRGVGVARVMDADMTDLGLLKERLLQPITCCRRVAAHGSRSWLMGFTEPAPTMTRPWSACG